MIGLNFDEIYDFSFKEDYYKAFLETGEFRGFNFRFNKKTLKENLEDLITETGCIEEKKILDYLLKNLKTLLIGNISDLRKIHFEISCKWTTSLSKSLLPKLKDIFDYDTIYNGRSYKKTTFGQHLFNIILEKFDMKVCPYCNEDYIKLIKVDDKGIIYRSPFEHFFPKSKYPYFSLSLANLVPSCVTCNSLKGEKDKNGLKNIYEINEGDFVFGWIPLNSEGIDKISILRNLLKRNEDLENTIDELHENLHFLFFKFIESNLNLFRIEERYDIHKDMFIEILLKAFIENDKKQEFLKNAFPDLNITEKDIYRFFFCNYLPNNEKDLLKRPLSKAVYDLYKELTKTSV